MPPPPPGSVASTLSNFATPFQSPHPTINEEEDDDDDDNNEEDEGRGGGNGGTAGRRPSRLQQVPPICYLGP